MKEKYKRKAYKLAGIGHWQFYVSDEKLYWSDEIKSLHEVPADFEPDLDSAIQFYEAGKHREKVRTAVKKAIQEGKAFDIEAKIITNKNNERWVKAIGKPEFKDGSCVSVFGSTQDITERKNKEQKIKQQQKKFRDIIEHSTIMFYRHDTNHRLTYISPQSYQFLGYPPEEAKQKWTEFATDHPANKKAIAKTEKAIETGESQPPYELQLRKASGEIIWVKVNESPIVEDGETVEIVGSLTDITALKNQQQELDKLSRVASETQNMVIITDADENIEWVNKAFTQITGYSSKEVLGKKPGELLQGPETSEETVADIARQIENTKTFSEEILNYTKEGEPYWIKMDITPITDEDGNVTQFFSIQEDITEHKKAIQQLTDKEAQLRNIANNIDGMIHRYKRYPDGRDEFLFVSEGVKELHEVSPEEVMESSVVLWDQIVDEHIEEVKASVKRSAENFTKWDKKWKIRTPSGQQKWIHGRGTPKEMNDGSVLWDTILLDITEQKKLEQSVSSQVSLLNDILDSIPGLFYMVREDLTFERTNQNVKDFFGLDQAELQATQALSFIAPRERNKAKKRITKAFQEGYADLETVLLSGDGEEHHFYMNGKRIELSGDNYVIGNGIDITKRVKAEEENIVLLQEVHHRVKNNLAIISGILTLELDELPAENVNRLSLERSINRIHAISKVHELLYQSKSFSEISTKEYVTELAETVSDTFENTKDIDYRFDIGNEIEMNINQIIPVGMLLNELLTNSLKYAFTDKQEGLITINIHQNKSQYKIHYSDNGRGFDKSAFENSSTLGFTIVNTLLKQLDASYNVNTRNGFDIELTFNKKMKKGSHSNL